MRIDDKRYYNLQKTLTYNAEVMAIIGAAGKGKTYTTRGYCLKQALKNGELFVEVCRTKAERDEVKTGYFDKLGMDEDFKGLEFDCRRNIFFARTRPPEEGEPAGDWVRVGYIVALSEVQTTKRRTYAGARNIIMDEFIIERIDRFHTYLHNEWNLLARVVNSCVREDANDKNRKHPRLFLLGNAVDLLNPYFQLFGIKSEPPYGYSWWGSDDLRVLLHYVPADEYDRERRDSTLAGRMSKITGYDEESFGNSFEVDNRYIGKKTKASKPYIGFRFEGRVYGIWADMRQGYYYVVAKEPPERVQVFSLTRDDDSPNYIAARAGMKPLRAVSDMYYMGGVLFDSPSTRENFLRAMRLFGIR